MSSVSYSLSLSAQNNTTLSFSYSPALPNSVLLLPTMFWHYKLLSLINLLLLLTLLLPAVQSRRGGGFGRGVGRGGGWGGSSSGRAGWGAGGGHYRPPPHIHGGAPHSSGPSAGKVAGAAAAGALGGMMIGHGLSSMARPGYGYGYGHGGYGGYGHGGYGHGYPMHGPHAGGHSGDHGDLRNETDLDYYTGSANPGPVHSCVVICVPAISLLLGHFLL